jgi:hypothetical protein
MQVTQDIGRRSCTFHATLDIIVLEDPRIRVNRLIAKHHATRSDRYRAAIAAECNYRWKRIPSKFRHPPPLPGASIGSIQSPELPPREQRCLVFDRARSNDRAPCCACSRMASTTTTTCGRGRRLRFFSDPGGRRRAAPRRSASRRAASTADRGGITCRKRDALRPTREAARALAGRSLPARLRSRCTRAYDASHPEPLRGVVFAALACPVVLHRCAASISAHKSRILAVKSRERIGDTFTTVHE